MLRFQQRSAREARRPAATTNRTEILVTAPILLTYVRPDDSGPWNVDIMCGPLLPRGGIG